MHLRAAQFFFGHIMARGTLHHLRTRNQNRRIGGHDRKMRRHQSCRRKTCHRPQRSRGDGNAGQGFGQGHKSGFAKHRVSQGAASFVVSRAANRSAAAFVQANERHFIFQRQLLGIDAFAQARRIGRAATDGKIFAANNHFAAFNLAKAENEIGGLKIFQFAIVIIFGHARAFADFFEAFGVEQCVDALANGETPFFMVLIYRCFAALLFGEFATGVNFIDFFFPRRMFLRLIFLTHSALRYILSVATSWPSPIMSPSLT